MWRERAFAHIALTLFPLVEYMRRKGCTVLVKVNILTFRPPLKGNLDQPFAMDSALQVDLAKSEAPAEQVLTSALGEAASHLAVPLPTDAPTNERDRNSESLAQNSTRRSSKGGYATTTQVHLKPKASNKSLSRHHPDPANNASLELGKLDNKASVYTLQPADEGFGAWSYVASAFAMYIVVWGTFQCSNAVPQFSCSQG